MSQQVVNRTEPAAAEDGVVRPGLQRELPFDLVTDDRDRPQSQRSPQLDRGRADAAGPTMHQQRSPGSDGDRLSVATAGAATRPKIERQSLRLSRRDLATTRSRRRTPIMARVRPPCARGESVRDGGPGASYHCDH